MTQQEIFSNTEQKIMDAATSLFAKKGFDATSTRDICKAANVNISAISYYYGGKEELYKRIVQGATQGVIEHVMSSLGATALLDNFDHLSRNEKIDLLLKVLSAKVDYLYSGKVSKDRILIFMREQISDGVAVNSFGYKTFKKLLASILDKDENDKAVIFRCLAIMGQVDSARILTQFSLKMLDQSEFTSEDIEMIKNITISQTKAMLNNLGVYDDQD